MSGSLSNFSAGARAAGEAALDQAVHAEGASAHGRRQRRVLAREALPFAGGELAFAAEDIAEPTQWQIEERCHTLIVHLDGAMQRLQTRIGRSVCRAPAQVGEVWLIPAGAHYVGEALGGSIAYAEYQISPQWLDTLTGVRPGDLRPVLKSRDPLLHGLTGRLIQLGGQGDDLTRLLRESMQQVIGLHLLREYTGGAAAAASPRRDAAKLGPRLRQRLQDYIAANLDQPLTLGELAGMAELSPHSFITAFRHGFGMTPIQYLIAQRLQRACALLESTRQDITAIALATGFSSHSHLSTAFRQRFGLTPRQFRAQARSLGGDADDAQA